MSQLTKKELPLSLSLLFLPESLRLVLGRCHFTILFFSFFAPSSEAKKTANAHTSARQPLSLSLSLSTSLFLSLCLSRLVRVTFMNFV